MSRLIGKIFITGKIQAVTGLHIGGTKTALDIGGVDLNVIKTSQGIPFIPGSSLKGKLRSLLAKLEGSTSTEADSFLPNKYIIELFGDSGKEKDRGTPARLLVRDAFALTSSENQGKYLGEDFKNVELELEYTEVKWENRIKRTTGKAEDPRQIERVPAGVMFEFEFVYDVYEDVYTEVESKLDTTKHLDHLKRAMQLLQDDYIGGHGSRGYGKIKFVEPKVTFKKINRNGEAIIGYQVDTSDTGLHTFAQNLV